MKLNFIISKLITAFFFSWRMDDSSNYTLVLGIGKLTFLICPLCSFPLFVPIYKSKDLTRLFLSSISSISLKQLIV